MTVYDVEFVFSCPYFIDILSVALNSGIQKNFEVACFLYHNTHKKKNYQAENFLETKSLFVSCFDHLSDAMYFDSGVCLHYNRRTFFQLIVKNSDLPVRKCYKCYRRTVKKLLKLYPRFVC